MSAQRQIQHEYTADEYRKNEQISTLKHEFYQGQIYAMAGTSSDHNRIAVDVTIALGNQLNDKPCEVFAGDQRIKVEATSLQTYPDVLVACPPLTHDEDDEQTLTDAVVIVEVLSRSTAKYDREGKFDNYKQLSSLRHYILIEQKQMQVEHHFLGAAGQWQSEKLTAPEAVVELRAIECQLVLRQIYKRVKFEAS